MAGVLTLDTAGLRSEWLEQKSDGALGSRIPEWKMQHLPIVNSARRPQN